MQSVNKKVRYKFMENTIKKLPQNNKRSLTEKESAVIKSAFPAYKMVMDGYEKHYEELRQKAEEKKILNNGISNPFDVNMKEDTDNIDNLTVGDIKELAYTSWALAVANAQTPFPCKGSVQKSIRKKAFRDVSNGKFINRIVLEYMDGVISRMTFGMKEKID